MNTNFSLVNFVAASPLEQFEVTKLVGLDAPIFGTAFTLTNLAFYFTLVVVVFLALQFFSLSNGNSVRLLPNRWNLGFEYAYTTVHGQTKEMVGSANEQYLPFVYSLFFLVLFGNLFGNVPYSFAVFASAIAALGMSVMIFLGVTFLAVSRHGLHFLSFFVPSGTPGALVPLLILIEIISYVARAFSLGIRLWANMVAGHSLLKILSGMIYGIMTSGLIAGIASVVPLAIFVALVGLEIAVSFIQSYVLCILVLSYIKDAIYLH